MNNKDIIPLQHTSIAPLVEDLRQIINQSRSRVAANVNAELTLMYWHIGERINREVLGNERAEYGKLIVSQLATQLQNEFGDKGFESRNIRRMMQFAQQFPQFKIVSQLATQLSWSHFVEVLPLKDDLQREFYLTMAASERWGRNQLRKEIDGMLFERTAISGKPDELIIADDGYDYQNWDDKNRMIKLNLSKWAITSVEDAGVMFDGFVCNGCGGYSFEIE